MMRRHPRRPLSPLARYRVARGLKQQDLAALMRVEPSTIHSWESGKFRPEPDRISKLAQHLGINPLEVVELIEQSPTQQETR
jgi:ribosome-binding protein aMBF1 (putative translation factor)